MPAGSDVLDKINPKVKLRLQKVIVQSVYESFIADGQLDPIGKTADQIAVEFFNLAKKMGPLKLIVTHGSTLLTEARRFVRRGKQEIALLFYVTWFEHWINHLIHKKASELKLSDKVLRLLLRQTGFEAKLKCFPTLAKVPQIQQRHIKAVLHCAELRNSFVHYKFDTRDDDKDEQYTRAIGAAEKAVKYLMRFEQRHIYKGAKHIIRKVLFSQPATNKGTSENI